MLQQRQLGRHQIGLGLQLLQPALIVDGAAMPKRQQPQLLQITLQSRLLVSWRQQELPGPLKGQVPTEADLPTSAAQGDSYIVQADDSFWVFDADTTAWVNGGSIQGPQGIEGAQGLAGVRGAGWFTGSGAPTVVAGSLPGDLYLDQVTGDVYLLQ